MDLFPQTTSPETPARHVYSVSEVTGVVRRLLQEELGQIMVEGEISNYRKQGSGHQYFTLKDGEAQLQCVLFSRPGLWRKAGPPLTDGMHVIARGNLTVYEARGQYQLNVQSVQAAGAGLLQARFEALKKQLEAEGLFAPGRKRSLPRFPVRLGIVTSPTGAALRDMLNILGRRSPWLHVLVYPARVQGEGAAQEIAAGLAFLNDLPAHGLPPVDHIVAARGGGSVEDLWQFNEEIVARAVAASALPVISAVGHETDFTICDFVADLRAPTPSAAAELVAPDGAELWRRIAESGTRVQRCAQAGVQRWRQHLVQLGRTTLFREPRQRLDDAAQRLDFAADHLRRALRERQAAAKERLLAAAGYLRQHRPDQLVQMKRHRLDALVPQLRQILQGRLRELQNRTREVEKTLRLLSPAVILQRGYALAFAADGTLLRSAHQVAEKDQVRLHFSEGAAQAEITRVEPDRPLTATKALSLPAEPPARKPRRKKPGDKLD